MNEINCEYVWWYRAPTVYLQCVKAIVGFCVSLYSLKVPTNRSRSNINILLLFRMNRTLPIFVFNRLSHSSKYALQA